MAQLSHTAGCDGAQTRLKHPQESHAQWHDRLASAGHLRAPGEPLLTPEVERRRQHIDALVTHVETNSRARTKRLRQHSAIAQMHERGAVTPGQWEAAQQIARVVERIARVGAIRGPRLEPRVDCAGSGRDAASEALRDVRLERTYNAWRAQLPVPRQMLIDMVIEDRELVATARRHNVPWRQARNRLIDALEAWIALRASAWREVSAEAVACSQRLLDGG